MPSKEVSPLKKNLKYSKEEEEKEEEKVNSTEAKGKRLAKEEIEDYFNQKNYYCKDLDLFIVMEPCIMCSMALGLLFFNF